MVGLSVESFEQGFRLNCAVVAALTRNVPRGRFIARAYVHSLRHRMRFALPLLVIPS